MANARGYADVGGTPQDFINSLPVVTRIFAGTCLLTTILVQFGIVSAVSIYLSWPAVLKLEIWRVVTNFFFLGGFSINFLMKMIWLVQYGKALESSVFQHNVADFVFLLMFGAVSMLAVTLVLPFLNVGFLGSSIVFMLLYVWSRHFPAVETSIMGLVPLKAFYLPFAFFAISVMMGGNWLADLLGIIAGHLYYFLKVLHPAAGGRTLIETPMWLTRLLHNRGIGVVPTPVNQYGAAVAPGFRAFRGGGRRLQD